MQLVSSAAMIVLAAGLGWNDVADVQVKTTGGMVRGAAMADGRVRVFKGIPYAAPPVGDLRWKEPRPARAWEGVARCHRIRRAMHAGPDLRRHRVPTAGQRGLPESEHLDAGRQPPAIDCR